MDSAIETPSTRAPGSRKRVVHIVLSVLTIALGIALLNYMITVEDELGALPLALVAGGIAWLVAVGVRLRPPSRNV